jgi:hypothetical protein
MSWLKIPHTSATASSNSSQQVSSDRPPLGRTLWGGFLLTLGYLLSPLCWWNDLVFNLPVAYGIGYLCRLVSPSLFLPGAIAGYWLSNLLGILLMQFGAIEVVQNQANKRNFAKDLCMGVATSTVYTLFVVAMIHFKFADLSAFIPNQLSLNISALLPFVQFGN